MQPEPLVYDVHSSETNVFTKSELYSMAFQDVADTYYAISRGATREIVHIFKSMLQDNLTSNNVPLGKHLFVAVIN